MRKISKYNMDYSENEMDEIIAIPLSERPYFITTDDFLSTD